MKRQSTLPWVLLVVVVVAGVVFTRQAHAGAAGADDAPGKSPTTLGSPQGGTGDARRHFTNGVHLFEDRNFAGALVEFEASFQLNPTASALQNIAVCQKGLFRYAEAIATLERMLRDFAAQLTPDDKKAAEDAMREMSALLGTVVVQITPPDARVSINGAPLSAEAMKSPVRLAAGEYRVAVEAPGYAPQEKTIRVISGQKDRPIVVSLSPLSGTLVIRAHDSDAAIAIDGVQVGYDEWKGPASAGPHEIYVYTSKLRHKSNVVAYAGQTTEFEAKLTPADAVPTDQPAPANGPPPYVPPSQRGIFGFLLFGADTMGSTSPTGLNQDKARTGGTFGALTLGYRFSTGFAAEFQAETSDHQIAACPATARSGCIATTGNYSLHVSRIGPAVRLMTSGRKARLLGTIGAGAAVHSLKFDATFKALGQNDVSSVGSYVSLTGSFELNLGHFLVDGGIRLVGESANETNTGGLKSTGSVGLEFRLGYGQW
jgi:PEGA domain